MKVSNLQRIEYKLGFFDEGYLGLRFGLYRGEKRIIIGSKVLTRIDELVCIFYR